MSRYEKIKPDFVDVSHWIFAGKHLSTQYIKKNAKKFKHIVYGSQALNVQLPNMIKKSTEDWDVYSKKPKQSARLLENQIDNYYKSDMVDVHPAKHKGTYRVLANMQPTDVADYTKPTRRIPKINIGGVGYQSLLSIEKERRQILKDPKSKYRHAKDRDVLRRIKDYRRWK